MGVKDAGLEPHLIAALETLSQEASGWRMVLGEPVVRNLQVMARMGVYFEEEVQLRRYPEFPNTARRMELGRLFASI